MDRIYFDKQILSGLFKQDKSEYIELLQLIEENKDDFLFCYSHAHLLDLKNDKTDIKFQELEFLQSFLKDNYLCHHFIDKTTLPYLANPKEAFDEIEVDETTISFSSLFEEIDLTTANPEVQETLDSFKKLFTETKLDIGYSNIDELPDSISKHLSKILPVGVSSMTLLEWSEHMMSVLDSMRSDKTVYKGLRSVVDEYLNNGKFTVEFEDVDFNDELKNSVLQKTFIEYVNGNLNPNGDKDISTYDFFTNAYFTLDLLGISKDSTKKVKFNNLLNDGIHAYYGAYCDFVVSDDEGFLKKAKVMYRLLGIETKVYSMKEFKSHFSLLTKTKEVSQHAFFELLISDLKNGLVIESIPSIKLNRHTTVLKPFLTYLGHFNSIESITENGKKYVLLRRKRKNYSHFTMYREYEGITNRAIQVFGEDQFFRGKFDWAKEIEEIKQEKWPGRYWEYQDFTVLLEINIGLKDICLLITLKT